MSALATRPISASEFVQMTFERPTELVRGELVEQQMPTFEHGTVCAQIAIALGIWAKAGRHGVIATNDAFVQTERQPDTVRGPDCGYIRRDRLPGGRAPRGALPVPLDLAVEVLSPSDRWQEVMDKILEYLRSGTAEVWVVDPELRTVEVYRDDLQRPLRFVENDELTRPDLLPGFSCRVADFFADL